MSSDCQSSSSHYWSTLRVGGSELVEEVVVVDREGRDQRVRLQYDPVSQAGQYSDSQGSAPGGQLSYAIKTQLQEASSLMP